jgi:hypothetical protein
MKNPTLIPLFSLTAAAAFGLGWFVRPDARNDQKNPNGSESADRKSRFMTGSRPSGGGLRSAGPESEFISKYLINGSISGEDMTSAIKEISDTNDPLLRQKMFAALLENLTSENARSAFLALREGRRGGPFGRGGEDQIRLLANAWGRIDGAGAVAALKEIASEESENNRDDRRGRGDRGSGALSGVLAGWATMDGAAASAYVGGIEDEREQRGAAFGVLQGMLVNGVDEAMGFVRNLPDSEDSARTKGFYMAMVTAEMLEQGLDQAKTWVDTVKEPELRTGALARVTMEIMNEDRAEAAEWIAQFGDEDAAAPAVNRLADDWANEDPKAVMDWAENLSGKSKAEAYEEAMQSWARQDPAAAGEYLSSLKESPERDAAVGGYATRVSREDPGSAMEWAKTINDEGIREETMVDVARDWYRNDKTAAEEWIASSGLSEEAVESITTRRDYGRGGRGR